MTRSKSLLRMKTMMVSLPCSLLVLISLDVASGFHGHLIHNGNVVGRSLPLLTTSGSAGTSISLSTTALGVFGMEGDPLEEDRRQRNAVPNQKRFVSPQQKKSGSPAEGEMKQQEQGKPRLVRPSKPPSAGNERKATTSTTAGVNMELKDPKERKLVRHATASAAYGVDDFKGKKKKIIKPWSSGRKKHKNRQNNTGGIAREAYGENLKVELRSKPKEKRLVMARTAGNQDAAKALISGGSKAKPLTAADLAEEKRLMEKRSRELAGEDVDDEDYYYYDGVKYKKDDVNDDGFDYSNDSEPRLVRPASSTVQEPEDDYSNDGEPRLVRPESSIVQEPEDDNDDGEPRLVRLESSIVQEPEADAAEEPNLVRLTSSIVRPPDDNSDEPNLVRMESSIVREPEEDTGEELKFYTRSDAPVEEEEQRLVRAVPMSQPPASDEPKLVRPNIVKEQVEGPKLVKPNIVRAKVEGPKLVRPNVRRAKPDGPKLVRANVQKEKRPESNLVRPRIAADGMDVGKRASTSGPPLVRPSSSAKTRDDFKVMDDLMYGANAATSSPVSVPLAVKAKKFVKPAFTSDRSTKDAENSLDFMYGSTKSSASPTSVSIDSKPKEYVNDMYVAENDEMESLMYGASKAATSPTAVSIESSKAKNPIEMSDSTFDNDIDNLMYGANKATESPTAVAFNMPKKKFVRPEASSDDSLEAGTSQPSAGAKGNAETSPDFKVMDDLMYGYQGALTSPTAVKVEINPGKFVKRDTLGSAEDSSQGSDSGTSTTLYPDGDKRKEVNQPRLVRASQANAAQGQGSQQKRYVKPSTSAMDRAKDWDAANPTSTTTNPTFVRSTGRAKKQVESTEKKKRYVQPSTSLMNNAPDWDAVKPATTAANPSVVSVDGLNAPKSKKEVHEYVAEEKKSDPVADKPKKKYVQPSTSLMDNAPDWDAVQPASTTANPSVVSVDVPSSKKEVHEYVSEEQKSDAVVEKPKKKYVQPSTSLMDSAPDWDAVQPATSAANPAVVSVDAPTSEKEVHEYNAEEKKSDPVTDKPKTKKYVQPSTSMMDSAPDWDAVKPATTTSNPSQVFVGIEKKQEREEKKSDPVAEKPKKKKYVQPSTSMMDSTPDWDAVQPAISTANPSVVSVDGIVNTGKEKRFVRPPSSSMDGQAQSKSRAAPADTPFEYKQVQSIPKENPAGAKPIGDEDAKTKLPAEIAHAAGSSSDGWTPQAHFPSDEEASPSDEKKPKTKKRTTPQYSSMENYDPDALPRPTGVIPLTVSSSAKDKGQLFRGEVLEPVEDDTEGSDLTDEQKAKKLFLYDGSNSQPKELWDFTMEGGDTKLDENLRPKGSGRLEEKTVSPFTRNVSKKDENKDDKE